jgi:hypothetical protein
VLREAAGQKVRKNPLRFHHTLRIAGLCVFGLSCVASDATGAELSRGRRIILNRGLQIQAMTLPGDGTVGITNVDTWLKANFTTMNFWHSGYLASLPIAGDPTPLPLLDQLTAAGKQWSRSYAGQNKHYLPRASEIPYLDNLVGFQFYDERSQTQAELDEEKAAYADWKQHVPNSMIYTNFGSGPGPVSPALAPWLKNYMAYTKPDMISFDIYPRFKFPETDPVDYSRNKWYANMQVYRKAGLAGNDGTGNEPIPYAQYLNLYRINPNDYTGQKPSESFVRMQQNASWAFGYLMVTAYVYNDWDIGAMFDSHGESQPNEVFGYVAETNRQSCNLGPALVRLVSTDIRMIKGSGYSSLPEGILAWTLGAGGNNYITGITPQSVHSDVLIGYFKPLLNDNSRCTFINGTNFMLVNGAVTGTAAESAESYLLNFNFTGTTYDSLARLNRDTGKVDVIPLTYTGGRGYKCTLTLEGGTGDLFAFWDSRGPLPTRFPEGGSRG